VALPSGVDESVDVAIVGAGAAGIMAAIWTGRTARPRGEALSLVALDGARRLGAKILVAGGGRCNVTHHAVDESAYAGSTRQQIRRVLQRFDVPRTIEFFRELGVELKREETGKLFPVTDSARTVLDALLRAAGEAGSELRHPCRVEHVERASTGFVVNTDAGALRAGRIVLATGGQALPRSGSDGQGFALARGLGHSITPHIFPALVPLVLPREHFLCALSGVAADAIVELRSGTGRRLASFTGAVLCTHFGLSGPAILDISRYYTGAAIGARETGESPPQLVLNWWGRSAEALEQHLIDSAQAAPRESIGRMLRQRLPERLARALCEHADLDAGMRLHALTREQRRAVIAAVCQLSVPVTGDRGFTHAEAAAGGVPLAELNLKTMESRITPGLYLCGEICDVDGRIGGFNFQWAWASGYVAGSAAGKASLRAEAV
jgi:predicted Rossmann fold flavoprotein